MRGIEDLPLNNGGGGGVKVRFTSFCRLASTKIEKV